MRGRDGAVEGQRRSPGFAVPTRFGGEGRPDIRRATHPDREIGGTEFLCGNALRSGERAEHSQEDENKEPEDERHLVSVLPRSVATRARSAAAEGSMPS